MKKLINVKKAKAWVDKGGNLGFWMIGSRRYGSIKFENASEIIILIEKNFTLFGVESPTIGTGTCDNDDKERIMISIPYNYLKGNYTDDELSFIIWHEISHWKLGHLEMKLDKMNYWQRLELEIDADIFAIKAMGVSTEWYQEFYNDKLIHEFDKNYALMSEYQSYVAKGLDAITMDIRIKKTIKFYNMLSSS